MRDKICLWKDVKASLRSPDKQMDKYIWAYIQVVSAKTMKVKIKELEQDAEGEGSAQRHQRPQHSHLSMSIGLPQPHRVSAAMAKCHPISVNPIGKVLGKIFGFDFYIDWRTILGSLGNALSKGTNNAQVQLSSDCQFECLNISSRDLGFRPEPQAQPQTKGICIQLLSQFSNSGTKNWSCLTQVFLLSTPKKMCLHGRFL